MRRFLTLALLAAVLVVVPAGSAVAASNITIDETVSGYTVVRDNVCHEGFFVDFVLVDPLPGTFTMEGGSAVDIKVTFDQGLEVRPGAASFLLIADLDPVGENLGGGTEFAGAQMIMDGTNIQSSFNARAFVQELAGIGVGAVGEQSFAGDSFLVNSSNVGRIDSFRTTFTVPAGISAGTVDARVFIQAGGSCSPGDDPDPLLAIPATDTDGDGVANGNDVCSLTDLVGDTAPARHKNNRLWSNAAGMFFYGDGDISEFTVADTGGCSASQVIDMAGLGNGHTKFGISNSAIAAFVASLNGG